jgi:hypothetical protein
MRIIGNNPPKNSPEITAVASGAISNGDTVVVNTDGTVGVIVDNGQTQGSGSPEVWSSGTHNYAAVTYDTNTQKVVVAYRDQNNSTYGTAVVGTVSGTSISFGTPVVFASFTSGSSSGKPSIVYDDHVQKVVVCYFGSTALSGELVVGTVSGTSISFGTPTVFSTNVNAIYKNSLVYDPDSQKVVIVYKDGSNSNYGTAVVGTVSGTSISLGTPVAFSSSEIHDRSVTYDTNAQKIVIVYQDSNYVLAIVGTVSGTSISFGATVIVKTGYTNIWPVVYDSLVQKIVLLNEDTSTTPHGIEVRVGTVTGNSVSFDAPVVIYDDNPSTFLDAVYDSVSGSTVLIYSMTSGSAVGGSAIVYKNSNIITNLTSENFIGFADNSASSGDTVRVKVGSNISTNQSNLTPSRQYFVQANGSLGLTASQPSVIAGISISDTEIIVKG